MSLKVMMETGRVTPGERTITVGGIRSLRDQEPRSMAFIHGSGETATSVMATQAERDLIYGASLACHRATMVVGDLGYQTWINNTFMARMDSQYAYMQSKGADPKIGLICASMGSGNGLGWALRNPDKVAFVAAMIPLLDLALIMSTFPALATEINAAYGGTYNDAVDGPTHSPIKFATALDPDLPITLFTASNDSVVAPSTATAFVAARPQTQRINIGALDHTMAAIAAAAPYVIEMAEEYMG